MLNLGEWQIVIYFRLVLSSLTNITYLATNKCDKMSIQYTVLGFELITFGTRVSSHNQ